VFQHRVLLTHRRDAPAGACPPLPQARITSPAPAIRCEGSVVRACHSHPMQDRTLIYAAAVLAILGIAYWVFLILRDVVQGRGHLRDWPWKKRRRNR